jgi:cytochrome c oxidase subunit 1
MATEMQVRRENRLVIAHVYVATIALMVGASFGLFQALSRASWLHLPMWFDYYRMLTAHGVLNAIVFTTFFICGLATLMVYRAVPKPRSLAAGWLAFWVMAIGTVMAAVTIIDGNASVLYTFYAPLKASPWFYVGTTLLVVGTWIVLWDLAGNALAFKRDHPQERLPLVVHGAVTTFVMWFIATLGVAAEMLIFLIPWSFGWVPTVNVMFTRMLFWYFGHPLVYFWIMGAYLIWYNIVPRYYNGKVFSDSLTRLTFILLLLLSTPVGLHHEFMEPGITADWKWVHTMTTYGVVIPSILTAFSVFASFEMAARQAGVRGFFQTIAWLPWKNPAFSGPALGMLLFVFGGLGGVVNASYAMDTIVHNTMWIVGHFHVTVGGPVALSFLGTAYWLIPRLTGRKLFAPKIALAQTWAWFIGMMIMSTSMHWAGLLGSPRRTDDVSYFGSTTAATWMPEMHWAAIGGAILFLSILMFVTVAVGTLFTPKTETDPIVFAQVEEHSLATSPALDRIGTWAVIAIVLAILAYAGPVRDLIAAHPFGAPGMRTW